MGTPHLHGEFNFTESMLETVEQSLRHSCRALIRCQGISLVYVFSLLSNNMKEKVLLFVSKKTGLYLVLLSIMYYAFFLTLSLVFFSVLVMVRTFFVLSIVIIGKRRDSGIQGFRDSGILAYRREGCINSLSFQKTNEKIMNLYTLLIIF